MKKAVGCLGILLLLVAPAAHGGGVLTGQAVITSGYAFLHSYCCADFNISAPQFGAGSGTPDWGDVGLPTPLLIPPDQGNGREGINSYSYSEGPQGLVLSVTGDVPAYTVPGNSGEYMGVVAPCLAGGIPFTGKAIISPAGNSYSGAGTFTAAGELTGYSLAGCQFDQPPSSSTLFDVTFSGAGIMTLQSLSRFEFEDVDLQFLPTHEPPTNLLMLGGILVLAAFALRKRLRSAAASF